MRKNIFFFLNHQILIENQGGKKIEYGLTASYINKTNKQNISM